MIEVATVSTDQSIASLWRRRLVTEEVELVGLGVWSTTVTVLVMVRVMVRVIIGATPEPPLLVVDGAAGVALTSGYDVATVPANASTWKV